VTQPRAVVDGFRTVFLHRLAPGSQLEFVLDGSQTPWVARSNIRCSG